MRDPILRVLLPIQRRALDVFVGGERVEIVCDYGGGNVGKGVGEGYAGEVGAVEEVSGLAGDGVEACGTLVEWMSFVRSRMTGTHRGDSTQHTRPSIPSRHCPEARLLYSTVSHASLFTTNKRTTHEVL